MGTVGVLRWLYLLGIIILIQGNETVTELEQRIETLEREGTEHKKLIAFLIKRLDKQEEQIQFQAYTIGKQQINLNRQEDQLTSQSKELEKQTLLLAKQGDQLEVLSQTLGKQKLRLDRQEDQLKLQSETLKKHQKQLNRQDDQLKSQSGTLRYMNTVAKAVAGSPPDNTKQKRLILGTEGPVAFHAVIDKGVLDHIAIKQKIIFEDVLENLGGSYNNQSGVFIAPTNGVYIFSVSIMSYYTGHTEVQVALMKNGVTLARAFGHGDNGRHDQGSVTVVTQLDQGNEVWIENLALSDDSVYVVAIALSRDVFYIQFECILKDIKITYASMCR